MNIPLQTKQLIRSTASMFFVCLEVQYNENSCSYGQLMIGSFIWQCICSCIIYCTEIFGETSNHPGDSVPLQPRFYTLQLLAFSKISSLADHWWDSGKYDGSWWQFWQRILQNILNSRRDTGRTVWGPKVPTLKRTEASLSLNNVSCIFFKKCLYFSYHVAGGYFLDTPHITFFH